VVVASALSVVLFLASAFIFPPAQPTWPLSVVSLVIVGALAVALTRRAMAEMELSQERRRLLAEVEQRAAVLDATITAIPNGLVIVGPARETVRMNAAAQAILGVSEEEMPSFFAEHVAGLRLETPDGQPVAPESLPTARALRGEWVQGLVLVVRSPSGRTSWVSAGAAPVRTAEGRLLGAVVTLTDITAIHGLEEQLRDLLRAVSHDLRSPLTAIQGQAGLLVRRLERGAPADALLENARSIAMAARRMNTLIQDLVDSARSESGRLELKRQPIDLPAFVRRLKQERADTLDTARVVVEGAEGLPPVWADPDRLERILDNLLSNALKYSEPGTPVRVGFALQADGVVTSVSDQGPGIAPEDLARLFQRYFRAGTGRERKEGVGLGLYITRQLVEAHGGRIWAESQVGVGSTFSFSMPIVPGGSPAMPAGS
jgi:PAS domain S-box-containing protein